MGLYFDKFRPVNSGCCKDYLEEYYADITFDTETSDNKTSRIISEVDDKVIVGMRKETCLQTLAPDAQSRFIHPCRSRMV